MKIAILTEGVSEYKALPKIYAQLSRETRHTLLLPVKVNVSPDARPAEILRACKPVITISEARDAELIILLLDREGQRACPGSLAANLENSVGRYCARAEFRVVYKDRMFENWLIADLDALRAQPRRFRVMASHGRQLAKSGADSCDAMRLMKSMVRDADYDKVLDSARIMSRADVGKLARNSRSFRHFLHVIQHSDYRDQCKRPNSGNSRSA